METQKNANVNVVRCKFAHGRNIPEGVCNIMCGLAILLKANTGVKIIAMVKRLEM